MVHAALLLSLFLLLHLQRAGCVLPAQQIGQPYFSPIETQHVVSVSVFVYAQPLNVSQIIYTIDGSPPVRNGQATMLVKSGDAIFLDQLGDTMIRAIGTCAPALTCTDSPEARKKYTVLNRCTQPVIEPNGGTFAGNVQITMGSTNLGEIVKIYYSMDSSVPTVGSSLSVDSGTTITLDVIGTTTLKAIAFAVGLAPSSVAEATFSLLPKVAPVLITPETNVFTISATLQFTCATPKSVIYYTLSDGDARDAPDPTFKSLTVQNLGTITIDQAGRHTVKAIAMESSMLPSDVNTKIVNILDRATKPKLSPAPGTYIGDIVLRLLCTDATRFPDDEAGADWTWQGGVVYYTIGLSTPSMDSTHAQCGQSILLKAPGDYVIRAFVHTDDMSNSGILQAEYKVARPGFDTFPAMASGPEDYRVQPVFDVRPVAKADGSARGRLLVLDNPVGHFDVILPPNGEEYGTVSDVGGVYEPLQIDMPQSPAEAKEEFQRSYTHRVAYAAAAGATPDVWERWEETYSRAKYLGCQVASSAGVFNQSLGVAFGSIVAGGNVIQTLGSQHNVHFGLRNGNFSVGYFAAEDINDPVQPFDALFAGAGWLVRDAKAYIQESLASTGDGEDLSKWPRDFVTAKISRTAIGYDASGRLLLLQIDGSTFPDASAGMSLYELSEMVVELGFVSAVNIQPGALTQNRALVSFPPAACGDVAAGASVYHCEDQVPTVLCIHAWPPMLRPRPDPTLSPVPRPAPLVPVNPAPSGGDSSVLPPIPTQYPTPSWMSPIYSDFPESPTLAPSENANMTMHSPLATLEHSLLLYKQCSYFLGVLLALSLIVHACSCIKSRRDDRAGAGGVEPTSTGGGGGGVNFSVPHRLQVAAHVSEPGKKKRGGSTGIVLTSIVAAADTGDADRSVYNLSATPPTARRNQSSNPRDWQAKLGSINLSIDSDTEDEDGVEVVDFYRRDLPQMRDGRKISTTPGSRPGSGTGKWSKPPAPATNTPYSQVGVDSDDEGDEPLNPFHRAATK